MAGIMAQLRNAQEKYRGRGASSRGFVPRLSTKNFFFVGDATQVQNSKILAVRGILKIRNPWWERLPYMLENPTSAPWGGHEIISTPALAPFKIYGCHSHFWPISLVFSRSRHTIVVVVIYLSLIHI